MKITEHFEDWEFRLSASHPELAKKIILTRTDLVKLFYICKSILEPVRAFYGKPIKILSGKRTPMLNTAVGGAKFSDHKFYKESCAVDWTVDERDKLFELYGWIWESCFYSVGELILYLDRSWEPRFIHVSLPTKRHHHQFYYDWNKGEVFSVVRSLPDSVYIKIFGEEDAR